MTKTLVERLRDQFDYEREHYPPANPVLAAAASRIEELERALGDIADGSAPPIPHGHYLAHRHAVNVARVALSEPSPDAPVKRIGAARYLEG